MTALPRSAPVAVVGAGAMGAGIAQVAAQAGHPVTLFDAAPGAAGKAREGILANVARQVEKGRLPEGAREDVAARLEVAPALEALGGAALVVEAIVERLEVKRQLFAGLEEIVAPDAILASNTSSLSITAIAAGLKHPERVAGLHFFNPAPVMALVEVVAGLASDRRVLDTLSETAREWGKQPVLAKSTPGFIVNRVARPFYAEGLRLLEEGAADAATIDAVVREAGGFRMGPFELMDLIGHDVNFAVTRSVFEAYFHDPRYRPSLTQQELVAAGWYGRKSGRGFYDHAPGAVRPVPATLPAYPAPRAAAVEGDLGPAKPLVALMERAGIAVSRRAGAGVIRLDGASLALSDGRTATARAAGGELEDLVLFDLALDYGTASRIAVAAACQARPEALTQAAGLFQALGKAVSAVRDVPGLIVARTVAMLANEAGEAVLTGVATPADIDRAMTFGVNYPRGPLAWGQDVGPARILRILENLQATYGEDRYRPSALLRHRVAAGQSLHTGMEAEALSL
ncbi:3-hydroxybutyryl-CoA dehydrogenase [Pseudochelatococcus lubricantis]|uniref:3-hydroxybutyryl-CoA dehydrogenase n=1 Tax=Pseudochelatococcus lubricantis TaxID=1538102 RepID=A0ABX0UWV8_9HYPH|nr:3-hydroxyacyl-CoA dehydrogenase PaaH [Pseudochelatococcus lubricantis]NIJ56364.1 3-hydroxybutyryl-CoA dehydrogenase [Pseudochelatococcus lubricantis]